MAQAEPRVAQAEPRVALAEPRVALVEPREAAQANPEAAGRPSKNERIGNALNRDRYGGIMLKLLSHSFWADYPGIRGKV